MTKVQLTVNETTRWIDSLQYEYFNPVNKSEEKYRKTLQKNFPYDFGDDRDLFPYSTVTLPTLITDTLAKRLSDDARWESRICNPNFRSLSMFRERKSHKDIYYDCLTELRYDKGLDRDIIPNIHNLYDMETRPSNSQGFPNMGRLVGGIFEMEFDSTNDDDFFYQWLLSGTMNNGEMIFYKGDHEDQFIKIKFWDCYCTEIGEHMSSVDNSPMKMRIRISPAITENRGIKHEKSWKVTEIINKPFKPEPYAPPIPLVTAVKGGSTALPNDEVEYSVTNYNVNVSQSDKDRVKWVVEVDGKQELQKQQGEKISLIIKEEWTGKEITVMPYLKKSNHDVSVKTKVNVEAVVVFVNGYWNSGKSDMSIVEPLKKLIAEETIGTQSKRGYWSSAFIRAANSHFQRKYEGWTSIKIEDKFITPIFIDGSNVWNSSGEIRFNAGWDEAEVLLGTDLIDKQVINASGKQMKRIFIVSHSMGAAHAEGMIAAWSWHGLEIERVLHFSAADNRDFQVKLPNCTYQINLVPDLVLKYKNLDDAAKTKFENFWKMMKRPYLDRPDVLMIERMLPNHYIEINNKDQSLYNHYYTKSDKVWELVPFLKE